MARIMAIDYGTKRCGLAVTDPLQIIANGLETVATTELAGYLQRYFQQEEVECVVLGEPRHKDGTPTAVWQHIQQLASDLKKAYPQLQIAFVDESYSSSMAQEAILQSGANRKKRQDKGLIDKVAATILLQSHLEATKYQFRNRG